MKIITLFAVCYHKSNVGLVGLHVISALGLEACC